MAKNHLIIVGNNHASVLTSSSINSMLFQLRTHGLPSDNILVVAEGNAPLSRVLDEEELVFKGLTGFSYAELSKLKSLQIQEVMKNFWKTFYDQLKFSFEHGDIQEKFSDFRQKIAESIIRKSCEALKIKMMPLEGNFWNEGSTYNKYQETASAGYSKKSSDSEALIGLAKIEKDRISDMVHSIKVYNAMQQRSVKSENSVIICLVGSFHVANLMKEISDNKSPELSVSAVNIMAEDCSLSEQDLPKHMARFQVDQVKYLKQCGLGGEKYLDQIKTAVIATVGKSAITGFDVDNKISEISFNFGDKLSDIVREGLESTGFFVPQQQTVEGESVGEGRNVGAASADASTASAAEAARPSVAEVSVSRLKVEEQGKSAGN